MSALYIKGDGSNIYPETVFPHMGLFGRKKDGGPVLREMVANLHWDLEDPFIFASHHFDLYPKGNERQAPPKEEIEKKDLGNDYHGLFGYRLYTSKLTPGFQLHSHWGYETVTYVPQGYVDHFDSLGNQGRYGYGDMQWITAGGLYSHCEMYPLAHQDRENPQLVTQIMINLPLSEKNTPPEVHTVWKEDLQEFEEDGCTFTLLAGSFRGRTARIPSQRSWAADPSHHVLILRVLMGPGTTLRLGPSDAKHRNIYITDCRATVAGKEYHEDTRLKLRPEASVEITMGEKESELWVLEGDPIGERQSRWGPVVLGTDSEVREANNVIRKKEGPEWQWEYVNQKQPLGTERFYRSADGAESRPTGKNPGEPEFDR